jgi:hypothetical protein
MQKRLPGATGRKNALGRLATDTHRYTQIKTDFETQDQEQELAADTRRYTQISKFTGPNHLSVFDLICEYLFNLWLNSRWVWRRPYPGVSACICGSIFS